MSEQIDKTSILREMRTSYAALKDMLAHIASWHHRLLMWLDAAVRNEEPTISGPDNVEEMDALNAQFYQKNKSRPLDEVLADFRTSRQQIMDIIQAMPEEDLMSPHRFDRSKGEPLWHLIAGDTFEHYQEHLAQIQEWLASTNPA